MREAPVGGDDEPDRTCRPCTLHPGGGTDTVVDFENSLDSLNFSWFGFTDKAAVLDLAAQDAFRAGDRQHHKERPQVVGRHEHRARRQQDTGEDGAEAGLLEDAGDFGAFVALDFNATIFNGSTDSAGFFAFVWRASLFREGQCQRNWPQP